MNIFYPAHKDTRFLTYRDPSGKARLSNIRDHLRKVSDTYFLVREVNKKHVGYHYHALMVMKKEPAKGWYKKGIHINLKKIGKPQTLVGFVPSCPELTVREEEEMLHFDPTTYDGVVTHALDKAHAAYIKRTGHVKHLDRVIAYMHKEMPPEPVQYTHYAYVVNGKATPLP